MAPEQRSIIYTGSITVKVPDVRSASDKAGTIAAGAGGFIGGDKRTLNGTRSEAQLVLRVPSAAFATTLDALGKIGTEEARSAQQEDVTEAVVDLDARIASQQASVNRTRALLARANTIGEIVSVESELTKREADLASLQARKRSLGDRVDLSTITVFLHAPDAPSPTPPKDETGFLAGLKNGWHAFVSSVEVLLTVVGALLPFAVAIAIVWLAVWWLWRRRPRTAARLATPEHGAVPATFGLPTSAGTPTRAATPADEPAE